MIYLYSSRKRGETGGERGGEIGKEKREGEVGMGEGKSDREIESARRKLRRERLKEKNSGTDRQRNKSKDRLVNTHSDRLRERRKRKK